MTALCGIFCALMLSCCLISAVLCRQFQASDLGCFIDHTSGVREFNGLKYLGLTRVGSASVSQSQELGDINLVGSAQMTHELCGSVCALGGFQFMALQAGKFCNCGNSYGSQGASTGSDCHQNCTGNGAQNCGGAFRNRVLRLSYTNGQNLFAKENRTFVDMSTPNATAFSTVSVRGLIECAVLCGAGCEAVVFSQQQRLCHLLEYAVVPAALSSASSGDFFVRG